jgi:hypothetical protein
MGIQILHYAHGNKRIGTYDVIHDIFSTIVQYDGFYMGREKLHVFPLATFNSFNRWINIVLTKDGIHTLVNIVISDPTCVNLLPQFCTT